MLSCREITFRALVMPSLPDLLADLESKVAFHRRQEGLCAEQEALFRERRSFHAAELARISQCYETLRAAAATAAEIAGQALPAESPGEDLGSRSRPKLTRMVTRVLEDKPASAPFGATEVTAEVNRRYAAHLRRPAEEEQISVILKRMAETGRLHRLRKGRPYYQALYSLEQPSP
jgi:hypothetical protein